MTLQTVTRQFCLKDHSLHHKSQGSTFRNKKRFKDKDIVPSLPPFFHKNILHVGTNFFWTNVLGMFYLGTNDQVMQGGS